MKSIIRSTIALSLLSQACVGQQIGGQDAATLHKDMLNEALAEGDTIGFYHNLMKHVDPSKNVKPLLTDDEIKKIHENDDLTAVIHIGPMKTGSSSIQASFFAVLNNAAETDRYVDASEAMDDKDLGIWNMVGCFRRPEANIDGFIICKPEALSKVHQVATHRNNIIVSAEYLTSPDTNIPAMKDFLRPWKKQKVVAYYRRYYDWLNSFHNQGNKNIDTPNRHELTDFLQREAKFSFWWEKMYITESLKRWGEHFTDFEVFNIHEIEDGDVRDSFFCKALPNADKTCEKFQKKKAAAAAAAALQPAKPTNPSVSFVYEDMSYYAKEMGLWKEDSTGLTLKEVSALTKEHQEKVLKLTAYDWGSAMECPDDETAQILLQRTLDTEKDLFPGYFAEKGEKEIREEFAKQVKTKMCHVRAKQVLEKEETWRTFYKNLNNLTTKE